MAEVCGEYLKKGHPVFVEGRLQSRSWDTPDGQKRSTMEVIALNVQFLRGQGAASPGKDREAGDPGASIPKEDIPDIQLDEPFDMGAKADSGGTPF